MPVSNALRKGLSTALRRILVAQEGAPFPGNNRIVPRIIPGMMGIGDETDRIVFDEAFTIPAESEARQIARAMRRRNINREPGRRRSQFEREALRNALYDLGLTDRRAPYRAPAAVPEGEFAPGISGGRSTSTPPPPPPPSAQPIPGAANNPRNMNLEDAYAAGDAYARSNYKPMTVYDEPYMGGDWQLLTPRDDFNHPGVKRAALRTTPFPDEIMARDNPMGDYVLVDPANPDRIPRNTLPSIYRDIMDDELGPGATDYSQYDFASAMASHWNTGGRHAADVPHIIEMALPGSLETQRVAVIKPGGRGNSPYVKSPAAIRALQGNGPGSFTQQGQHSATDVPLRGGRWQNNNPHLYGMSGFIAALAAALAGAEQERAA